ncbi:MAG: hypothetical protein GX811_08925, partial [Lentisphaerae bacterium]|nr:hypothetical protein [Lentisphaerota bacterium]
DVVDLKFFARNQSADLQTALVTNELPANVEIYLEVLGKDTARRVNGMNPGTDQQKYVDRNSKRFSTRVAFNNRTLE